MSRSINFSIVILFVLGAMTAQAQFYSVMRVYGSECVGSPNAFAFTGSGCSYSWGISSGGEIVAGHGTSSIQARWNSPQSSAYVYVSYSCSSGSGTAYSSYYNITNTVTPSVGINISSTSVCQGTGVTLSPVSPTNGGGSPSYSYYVDGSYVGSGSSFNYVGGAGSHSAYVVMSSSHPCTSQSSATSGTAWFTVNGRGTYSVQNNGPLQVCGSGASGTFYAQVSGTYNTLSYQWYKNGSPVASGNPYVTNLYHGETVYVVVTSDGCVVSPVASPTYTVNVTGVSNPWASVQVNKLNFCSGENITFTASTSHGGSYTWRLSGNYISSAASFTISTSTDTNAPNTFSPGDVVTLDVTGMSGACLSTTSASASTSGVPIVINPLYAPSVDVLISSTNICLPGGVTLTASPVNPGPNPTYDFFVDGQLVQSGSTPTYSISSVTAGVHGVQLGMYSNNICQTTNFSASVVKTFTGTTRGSYAVQNNGPITVCAGTTSGTFMAVASGSYATLSYQWYKNGSPVGAPEGQANPLITSIAQGNTVYCVVTSSGCYNSPVTSPTYTVNITPNTTPVASIQVNKLDHCQGETLTLTAGGTAGGVTYSWSLSGGAPFATTSQTTLPVSMNTTTPNTFSPGDVVTLNVSGYSGTCYTSTTASASTSSTPLTVNPWVTPTMSITPITNTVCAGTRIIYTATPTGGGQFPVYQWFLDNVVIPGATTTTYQTSATLGSGVHTIYAKMNSTALCLTQPSATSNTATLRMNTSPVVNAGVDLNVTLPNRKVQINGTVTDPDGPPTITWTKVAGSGSKFDSPNAAVTTVRKLEWGTSTFRLSAQDQCGTVYDEVNVNVAYPPNNFSWIRETLVLVKDKLTEAQVASSSITAGDKKVTTTYYDGLGRVAQAVAVQNSPLQRDEFQTVYYDNMGRPSREYLPVAAVNTTAGYYADIINPATGAYQGIASSFYAIGSNNGIADDTRPFSETTYELTPLQRPVKVLNAGSDWATADKPARMQYVNYTYGTGSSMISEKVILWHMVGDVPKRYKSTGINGNTGYYASNTLMVTVSTDENGLQSREYTDLLGRLVLKKVQAVTAVNDLNNTAWWAQTYYIYDDFGNLRCVLQPELSRNYSTSTTANPSVADLAANAFQYKYDDRQRVIEKKSPGADPVYLVYDNRNRVILTQDGNLRRLYGGADRKAWAFIKYDALNRPVMTGIYSHSTVISQTAMSGLVNNLNESYDGNATAGWFGYTNTAFPVLSTATQVLTVTYYDNYKFRDDFHGGSGGSYGFDNALLAGMDAVSTRVAGSVTGSVTNVLESTTNYMLHVNYFDSQYRTIQVKSKNHKGGVNSESNLYDFSRLKETKTTHVNGASSYSAHRKLYYDHAGRMTKVTHKFHDQTDFVTIKQNAYNELGQIAQKSLHSRNSSPFAQVIDYSYNIRGWIDKINDPSNPATDLFNMQLRYHQPTTSGGPAMYNGNVSEFIWRSAGGDQQSYGYKHDAMNRLLEANYYNAKNPLNNNRYSEKIGDPAANPVRPAYDMNGNILNLIRRGKKTATTYDIIDDLRYLNYVGNQTSRIDDAIADTNFDDGFKDPTEAVSEYLFDYNGNSKKDGNKGITDIQYNYLNLPIKVSKSSTEYITYTYDATGKKLAQQVFGTQAKTTDYIGEYVYQNNVLQFVDHEEGRIVPDTSPGAPRPWEYQYFLKDHLGNVRVVFSEKKSSTEIKATFESTSEASGFGPTYNRLGSMNEYDHTDVGTASTRSHLLNAGNNSQIGIAKSLAVNPGDVIDMEVYAKYEAPTTNPGNLTTLFNGLVSAFGLQAAGAGAIDGAQAYSAFNGVYPGAPHIGPGEYENDQAPKAYLNYLLFSENFTLLDLGYDQISIDAKQIGTTPVVPHDYLSLHVKVSQKGFLYIFVSNEQPVQTNVYFDDFKITVQTSIEQLNDFYPFGLAVNSTKYQRTGGVSNSIGYQSQEIQDELGVNIYQFKYRMYDPGMARFYSVDPIGETYVHNSVYAFAENRVADGIELEGLEWRNSTAAEVTAWMDDPDNRTAMGQRGYMYVHFNRYYTWVGEEQYEYSCNQESGCMDEKRLTITALAIDRNDGAVDVLGADGNVTNLPHNAEGMVELPESGTGFVTHNRNDVVRNGVVQQDQWGTAANIARLMNAAVAFFDYTGGSNVSIGDLSLPNGESPYLYNTGPTRHGSHYQGSQADWRYPAADGKNEKFASTSSADLNRTQIWLIALRKNGFDNFILSPLLKGQVYGQTHWVTKSSKDTPVDGARYRFTSEHSNHGHSGIGLGEKP